MGSQDRVVVGMYSFRCEEPRKLAAFWADFMQLPTADGATDDLVMLDFAHEVGPATWLFQRATTDAPAQANRIGFDVALDDVDAENWTTAADRAEAAGATRLGQHEQDGARWIEMLDPEGNPFRVFGPRPA